MGKSYKPYDLDQTFLLPPSLREWLPANHLVYFVADVVNTLDLSKIEDMYGSDERGQPPYHPAMMVALLLYAYCIGIPSSRKIESKTYERKLWGTGLVFCTPGARHYQSVRRRTGGHGVKF